MRRSRFALPLPLGFVASLFLLSATSACSHRLSDDECRRYRDRLVDWAASKGVDRKTAADEFMKSCGGTQVSRSAHACMEKATDEKTFMACLD